MDVVDSLQVLPQDSIPSENPANSVPIDRQQVLYSPDSLDAPVDYNAVDSMIYDIRNKKIHLFGDATVKYTTINLKADYIIFDWESNIVTAEGLPDSTGKMAGFPEFEDGAQSFTAKRMRYNFKTQKGIVYDVRTQQNDVYVLGSRSKFVSDAGKDSTERNDIVYSQNAIFTTCTHEHPHFGIRSNRQKVIPNKLVVVGPSNLEIMGVPTPLWLPFGFFPIPSGRQTGLLFPDDYEYSPSLGFGLRGIGWYFPLGDHFNLALTTDLYMKGSWRINAASQYRKRYKYNGSFNLGYSRLRTEAADGSIRPDKSFQFRWSHSQASTAHPTSKFGGSINIQTNDFQSRNFNDARSVLNNQLSSNLTFSKQWQDLPLSMNASFNHNQNTSTRNVSISFPNVQFRTRTIYPFRSKKGGKKRWYEDINVRYSNDIKNQFDATDTTLFSRQTLEDARFGVRHDASANTSFKVFKYFNLNPNFSYREVWYTNTIERNLVQDITIDTSFVFNSDSTEMRTVFDTTVTNSIDEMRNGGFDRFYQMSAGLSLNTQIFGTLLFKKGWLRGLRHVIKPTIGFSFSPDYLNPKRGWFDFVENPNNLDLEDRYSIFRGGIFGAPSASGRQASLTYGFTNIFEAKIFSKKDSTERKIKLFNNINVSGNYNFAADTLKWSPINASGTARFFKGATTLSVRATWDPYITDEFNRRINRTNWRVNGKLLRFVGASASFGTRLTVAKIRELFQGKEEEFVEDVRDSSDPDLRGRDREQAIPLLERGERRPREKLDPSQQEDFLSLFENFRINHNLAFRWDASKEGDEFFTVSTHAIDVQGQIKLTPNWDITVGRIGYDFVRKSLTYPSVGFRRDLHCWEMGMDWQPTRGTYRFYIQVRPGTLGFIRIPYQQNNFDATRAF